MTPGWEQRASDFRVAVHRYVSAMDEMGRACGALLETDGPEAVDSVILSLPPALREMFRLMVAVGEELPSEVADSARAAMHEVRSAPVSQGRQRIED